MTDWGLLADKGTFSLLELAVYVLLAVFLLAILGAIGGQSNK